MILDISKAFSGSVHDFEIFKQRPFNPALRGILDLMEGVIIWADSAYIAIPKLHPDWESRIHERGKRNSPLNDTQKISNRSKSKTRISVEHTISRIKKYRCCLERVRNMTPAKQTRYWNIVAGICNLRLIQSLEIQEFLHSSCKIKRL